MPAILTNLVVAPCLLHNGIQVKMPQVFSAFKHMTTFKQVLEYHCHSLNFNGTLGHRSRINWYLCSLNTWDGLACDFFASLDQQVDFYPSLSKYFKHIYKNKPNLLPIFHLSALMTSRTQTTDLSNDLTYKSSFRRHRQLITPAVRIPTLLHLCCMWLAWKMKLNFYNRSNLIHDLEL